MILLISLRTKRSNKKTAVFLADTSCPMSHVELFFCFFVPQKTWLYEEVSHFPFILNGIEKFIFCKLFETDIKNEKKYNDMRM